MIVAALVFVVALLALVELAGLSVVWAVALAVLCALVAGAVLNRRV